MEESKGSSKVDAAWLEQPAALDVARAYFAVKVKVPRSDGAGTGTGLGGGAGARASNGDALEWISEWAMVAGPCSRAPVPAAFRRSCGDVTVFARNDVRMGALVKLEGSRLRASAPVWVVDNWLRAGGVHALGASEARLAGAVLSWNRADTGTEPLLLARSSSAMLVADSFVAHNIARGVVVGRVHDQSTLALVDSHVAHNRAEGSSSVLAAEAEGVLELDRATVQFNDARYAEGVVSLRDRSAALLTTCVLHANNALDGAVWMQQGSSYMRMHGCRATSNIALADGGVASIQGTAVAVVTDSVFAENRALRSGGAVAIASINLVHSVLERSTSLDRLLAGPDPATVCDEEAEELGDVLLRRPVVAGGRQSHSAAAAAAAAAAADAPQRRAVVGVELAWEERFTTASALLASARRTRARGGMCLRGVRGERNRSGEHGGFLWAGAQSLVHVVTARILRNAARFGGAFASALAAHVELRGSVLEGNQALLGSGGAFEVNDWSLLRIADSHVGQSFASQHGGHIAALSSPEKAQDSLAATAAGHVFFESRCEGTTAACLVSRRSTATETGVMPSDPATALVPWVVVRNSTLAGGRAGGYGGAIIATNDCFVFVGGGSELLDSEAAGDGGAVHLSGPSVFHMSGARIAGAVSGARGGALFATSVQSADAVQLHDVEVRDTRAAWGHALYVFAGNPALVQATNVSVSTTGSGAAVPLTNESRALLFASRVTAFAAFRAVPASSPSAAAAVAAAATTTFVSTASLLPAVDAIAGSSVRNSHGRLRWAPLVPPEAPVAGGAGTPVLTVRSGDTLPALMVVAIDSERARSPRAEGLLSLVLEPVTGGGGGGGATAAAAAPVGLLVAAQSSEKLLDGQVTFRELRMVAQVGTYELFVQAPGSDSIQSGDGGGGGGEEGAGVGAGSLRTHLTTLRVVDCVAERSTYVDVPLSADELHHVSLLSSRANLSMEAVRALATAGADGGAVLVHAPRRPAPAGSAGARLAARYPPPACGISAELQPHGAFTLALCAVLGVFTLLVAVFGLLVLLRYRAAPMVRASSPELTALIPAGCSLAGVAMLVLMVKPTTASCSAIAWLQHMGFVVTFGMLFLLQRRVARVFSARTRVHSGGERNKVMVALLCCYACACVLFAGYLLVWTLVDPPAPAYQVRADDAHAMEGSCDFSSPFSIGLTLFEGAALVMAGVLAVLSYDLPSVFSRAKVILLSLWTMVFSMGILVPLYLFMNASADVLVILQVIALFLSFTTVLLLICGPIFKHAWSGTILSADMVQKDIDQYRRRMLGKFDNWTDTSGSGGSGGIRRPSGSSGTSVPAGGSHASAVSGTSSSAISLHTSQRSIGAPYRAGDRKRGSSASITATPRGGMVRSGRSPLERTEEAEMEAGPTEVKVEGLGLSPPPAAPRKSSPSAASALNGCSNEPARAVRRSGSSDYPLTKLGSRATLPDVDECMEVEVDDGGGHDDGRGRGDGGSSRGGDSGRDDDAAFCRRALVASFSSAV